MDGEGQYGICETVILLGGGLALLCGAVVAIGWLINLARWVLG